MTKQDHDLIDKYLNDAMDATERSDFEKRLSDNPDLANALDMVRSMNRFLLQRDATNVSLQHLQSISNDYRPHSKPTDPPTQNPLTQTAPKPVPIYRNPKTIVAVFLIAAALGLLLLLAYLRSDQATPQRQQHRPLAAEQSSGNPQLAQAIRLFNAEEYAQAIPLLRSLSADEPRYRLALGIAYLETADYAQAQQTLTDLTAFPIYQNEAYWYLALTALQQDDQATAKTWLEKIAEDSPYAEKAQALMRKW